LLRERGTREPRFLVGKQTQESTQTQERCRALRGLHPAAGLNPASPKEAHACPTPRELRVVRPPIHPRVRPAENGGEFFVLCFQPVTFPRALCAQVAPASARATMATAHSGSARDRHWIERALGNQCTIQAHSPHSGNRRARPRPGQARGGSHPAAGFAPGAQLACGLFGAACKEPLLFIASCSLHERRRRPPFGFERKSDFCFFGSCAKFARLN